MWIWVGVIGWAVICPPLLLGVGRMIASAEPKASVPAAAADMKPDGLTLTRPAPQ